MSRPDTPERIALEELVATLDELLPHGPRAPRLILALNAARNALHMGKVLDDIAADPDIARGHVGSVG